MSIGGHQSPVMLKDEWLTPPELIKALGCFDLDPCAPSPESRPWDTANWHLSKEDDGLSYGWNGRVWCNPPYGKEAALWLAKLADHGNGVALIFARTETAMFVEQVWGKATALLFIYGRLHFHHVDGSRASHNSGAPSVLVAYGVNNANNLRECRIPGKYISLMSYSWED